MSMALESVYRAAVIPALSLLPPRMDSTAARLLMLAITLQEAEAIHRVQMGGGPAHGLWQMEEGGGVRGVMTHPMSRDWARTLCSTRHLPYDRHTVYEALANDDILAAGFARLLLWTDFHPIPSVDAPPEEGLVYYERNWQPGKRRPDDWPKNHAQARALVLA
jgi:hypothetical protein